VSDSQSSISTTLKCSSWAPDSVRGRVLRQMMRAVNDMSGVVGFCGVLGFCARGVESCR